MDEAQFKTMVHYQMIPESRLVMRGSLSKDTNLEHLMPGRIGYWIGKLLMNLSQPWNVQKVR
jgi:hypothetical protein